LDCGYNGHPVALHFDHRNQGEKSFKISSGLNRNLNSLLAEIAKCDVRCANCHAIKTVVNKENSTNKHHSDEVRAYLSDVMKGNKNAVKRV
jgi:hypothetical protein